jgi:hypothetical protein
MPAYPTSGQFGGGPLNFQFMRRPSGAGTPIDRRKTYERTVNSNPNEWMREIDELRRSWGLTDDRGDGRKSGTLLSGLPDPNAGSGRANALLEESVAGGGAGADPAAAIQSYVPLAEEKMKGWFGDAARKFGMMGMLPSSSYMERLGKGARAAGSELANVEADYRFRAQESAADRAQRERDRLLSAANSLAGWDQDAWNRSRTESADSDSLASMLGDWYLTMREGDEGRRLTRDQESDELAWNMEMLSGAGRPRW